MAFAWPVYRMVIAADGGPLWRRLQPQGRGPFFIWATRGAREPEPIRDPYDPTTEARTLLQDASVVDVRSDAELLAFVHQYGLLGVGPRGDGRLRWHGCWDSVPATRDVLEAIQRRRRLLPLRDEASRRRFMRGLPPEAAIDTEVRRPRRPLDVLWAELYDWARTGREIRVCAHQLCSRPFLVKHGRQKHCDPRCAANARAKNHYDRGRSAIGGGLDDGQHGTARTKGPPRMA